MVLAKLKSVVNDHTYVAHTCNNLPDLCWSVSKFRVVKTSGKTSLCTLWLKNGPDIFSNNFNKYWSISTIYKESPMFTFVALQF